MATRSRDARYFAVLLRAWPSGMAKTQCAVCPRLARQVSAAFETGNVRKGSSVCGVTLVKRLQRLVLTVLGCRQRAINRRGALALATTVPAPQQTSRTRSLTFMNGWIGTFGVVILEAGSGPLPVPCLDVIPDFTPAHRWGDTRSARHSTRTAILRHHSLDFPLILARGW